MVVVLVVLVLVLVLLVLMLVVVVVLLLLPRNPWSCHGVRRRRSASSRPTGASAASTSSSSATACSRRSTATPGDSSATLRVLCYGSAAKTAALIACERRCDDGIDDFLANLGRDFDLAVEWNSYADAELEALLATSHIGAARKPLRIYRATRVGAAGIAGSVGAASDVPVRDYSETLKRACAAEWREDDDPGDDREKAGEVPASLEAGGGHGRADDSDSGDDGGDDQHPLPEEVVLPPAPRGREKPQRGTGTRRCSCSHGPATRRAS